MSPPPDCVLRLQQVLWVPAPKLQLPLRVLPLLFQYPHRPGMHPAAAQQPPTRLQNSATVARSKVEQQRHNHKPVVSLPIDIYRLELELATYPDRNFVHNLLSTLKEGARIDYTGPRSDRVSPNLISAAQHSDVVSLNLIKEGALGRVAGPYPSPPLPKFQYLPVGVVPKSTRQNGALFTTSPSPRILALTTTSLKTPVLEIMYE